MTERSTKTFFLLAIGFLGFGSALAGTLDPPGPPAPTMVTLQQIYDKVCASSDVAKTGETGCWDTTGVPIPCAGTGQDGQFQIGVAVSPRFTDNGNGTVKDNLTGLIWLKNASCFGERTWAEALSDANLLSAATAPCGGLTDGSVAGSWRLPNIRELQSLVDHQTWVPSLPSGHPFTGVNSGVERGSFYSSTTVAQYPFWAWFVNFDDGATAVDPKTYAKGVWPVLGGQ